MTMLNPSVPTKLTVRIGKIDTLCGARATVRATYPLASGLSKVRE
jgi:hypothetical protein